MSEKKKYVVMNQEQNSLKLICPILHSVLKEKGMSDTQINVIKSWCASKNITTISGFLEKYP